jgi:hypothetical protein
LIDVETVGLQKLLKLVFLRLETQADTTPMFANVAANMTLQIAAIAEMAPTG